MANLTLTGTEVLQVLPITASGLPAATTGQTTTGAIAALAAAEGAPFIVTSITTAGNGTLTAAGLVGGEIVRTGPSAVFSDATDTAVAIIAALPGAVVGGTFTILLKNATAFTQTITAGAGVTLPPTVIIPAFSVYRAVATVATATTITMVHINTTEISTGANSTVPAITAISTVGAGTLTAASFVGGIISRTGSQSGTAFADTTDTAAAIIAACANLVNKIGTSMLVEYANTTNATATISGGTGVTVSGVSVIPPSTIAQFLVTYTAAATLTMVGLGVTQNVATAVNILGSSTGSTALASANSGATNYTATLPANTGTIAELNLAQTWTAAQTFTNSDLLLLGSSTGANTFTALNASATNYTTSVPAVTGVMASTSGANLFTNDVYRSSASITANANVTPQTITGLAGPIVIGTYRFRAVLPSTVASGTGGIAYNFLLTTATLSAIQYGATMTTASAVQYTQGTTATSGTVIATQAAVVLNTVIEGTFVCSLGGTFTLQMAQNTSNASNSISLIGSSMELTRIA